MSTSSFCLRGHVLESGTDARLEGIIVRLLKRRRHQHIALGSTVTGADGAFSILLSEAIGETERLRLAFFSGDQPRAVEQGTTSWLPLSPPVDFVYRLQPTTDAELLDDVVASPPTGASVRGLVRHCDGSPIANITVEVFQRSIGELTSLGQVATAADGTYLLTYTQPAVPPNIYVQVQDTTGTVLTVSALHFSAAPQLRVDLTVEDDAYQQAPEFSRLHTRIAPLLSSVQLDQLDGDDVMLLVGQLRLPLPQVRAYILARRLALKLTPDVESLFALMRQQLPSTPYRLVAIKEGIITKALRDAAQHNQITQAAADSAATTAQQLRDDAVVIANDDSVPGAMGALLRKAAPELSAQQRLDFLQIWTAHTGALDNFWTALTANDATFDVSAAQRAMQLGIVTINHPPLAAAFLQQHPSAPVSETAALTEADWTALLALQVDGADVSVPAGISGSDETEKRSTYAALLVRQAEELYPSVATAAAFQRNEPTADISIFLQNNPTFAFGSTYTRSFWSSADLSGLTGAADDLKKRIRTLQRLYRITPVAERYPALSVLESAALTSSLSITRMGKRAFLSRYGAALGGAVVARDIYNRARRSAAMAQTLYTQNLPPLCEPSLPFIPATALLQTDDVPDYEEIFTNQVSLCACKACQSILSPAAYFVDLMHWLDEHGSLSVLLARRSDLGELKLSCDNTNQALPTIDLAIEILEAAVINEDGTGSATIPDETTRTSAELLAMPEHVDASAYAILKQAQGPIGLPFHYPLAQVRAYLQHLGTPHHVLLETFQSDGSPTDLMLDIASLQLSPEHADLLTDGTMVSHSAPAMWGVASALSHPVITTDTVDWWVAVRYVPEFLARVALQTHEELLDLLHCRYVNASGALDPVLEGSDCTLASMYLGEVYDPTMPPSTSPGSDDFTRVQVFRRLHQLTGWSVLELDKVLHGLGVQSVGGDTGMSTSHLSSFAHIMRLQNMIDVDLVAMMSWWSLLDTYEDRDSREEPVPSLYDRLFLDASVVDPDTSDFRLNATRDALATPGTDLLANHEAELLSALRTSAETLADAAEEVASALGLSGGSALERKLDHLWRLARRVHLGQVAGLSQKELSAFIVASGFPPFTSPASACDFFDAQERFDALGLSVQAMGWWLAHDADAVSALSPTDDWLQESLGLLRDTLRVLSADADSIVEVSDASTVMSALEAYVTDPDSAPLDDLLAIIDGSTAIDEASQMSLLTEHLGTYLDIDDAVINLIAGGSELADADARYAWFLGALRAGVLWLQQVDAILLHLSEATGLDKAVFSALRAVDFTALTATDFTATFTDGTFTQTLADEDSTDPWADLDRTSQPEAFAAFDLLLKIAHLFTLLDVDEDRIAFWLTYQSPLELLDLTTLPVTEDASALSAQASGLYNTALLFSLDAKMPGAEPPLLELLGARADGKMATAHANLLARTEWTEDDLSTLNDRFQINHTVTIHPDAPASGDETIRSLTLDETTVDAVPGVGGWTNLDELVIALQSAVGSLASAVSLDTSGAVTVGTAGGGNAAVSLRITPLSTPIDVSSDQLPVTGSLPSVAALESLLSCAAVLDRLGAAADAVVGWLSNDPSQGIADAIRQVARSRYDSAESWSAVARPIRDEIRPRQRDALVRWLIAQVDALASDADLHRHYLIDVGMSPCMLTTRIKQGIASVQLFIQRCFLGLESDSVGTSIQFDEEQAEQWAWMKSYRVWEAARRVFLYPENWIEPELRQQKTPFFDTLEGRIVQGEINDSNVEKSVIAYLEQMHDLSNPFIIGLYHEYEAASDTDERTDILHVFAQTRADPPSTWYRQRDDGAWSPWQPVALDIQARRVAPVVFARRLMLFWVVLRELQGTDSSGGSMVEIELMWSEHQDGVWSGQKKAPESITTERIESLSETIESRVNLKSSISADGQLTLCITYRVGHWSEHVLGTFALDPCTWELLSASGAADSAEEVTGPSGHPGYLDSYFQGWQLQDGVAITIPYASAGIAEDYTDTPTGYTEQLLEPTEIRTAVVTFPHQFTSFVGQSPFVVQEESHAYLFEISATTVGTEVEYSPEVVGVYLAGSGFTSPVPASPAPAPGFLSARSFDPGDAVFGSGTNVQSTYRAVANTETPSATPIAATSSTVVFQAERIHHPYVCEFLREVRYHGIWGLYAPDPDGSGAALSLQAAADPDYFTTVYTVGERVDADYPISEIDFEVSSPQGIYNWELFFHIPLYVAARLSDNQQFDDAMSWYHAIFDPRKGEDEAWRIKPLRDIEELPVTQWATFTGAGDDAIAESFRKQVAAWEESPSDPHVIAQLRPTAYQRAVVMKYLDNIIAWGDERFSADTLESINEATQLYLYASDILGERTVDVTSSADTVTRTYNELAASADGLDEFSNLLISIEELLPAQISSGGSSSTAPMPLGSTAYFCVPKNPILMGYWDTLEDRLYKIRSCLNIQGVFRILPIYEPPIDPAALVRTSAAGADLGSAITSNGSVPPYRFSQMLQAARGLVGSVRALGSALLSAMEKQDAEALSQLRSSHEGALYEAMRDVRKLQLDEAGRAREAAEKAKALSEHREAYYNDLISQNLLPEEEKEDELRRASNQLQRSAQNANTIASASYLVPNFSFGDGFSNGGSHLGAAASAVGAFFQRQATEKGVEADAKARKAMHRRRKQDWKFQKKAAQKEQEQHDKQIAAAQVREELAQRELSNIELQISQRQESYDFLRTKFTNAQLYSWMTSQLAGLHAQSYQLALDVARTVEACYRYELGVDGTSFVQFSSWDSLRKGILSGDKLAYDLDRMEASYLQNNIREYELTKHIALSRLDPLALEQLREEGECWVDLPAVLFDLDCPGHYFRRMRSVSVTIACVSGAQRQINLQLTLLSSQVQKSTSAALSDESTSVSVVTSAAIEDPGVFSSDPAAGRYLPFEGRGAISRWHLRFCNTAMPQLDWSTISDVVLHMRYTARDGGEAYRTTVMAGIDLSELIWGYASSAFATASLPSGFAVAIRVASDEPDALYLAQKDALLDLELSVGADRLPFFAVGGSIILKSIHVVTSAETSITADSITIDGSVHMLAERTIANLSVGEFLNDDTANLETWPDVLTVTLSGSDWSVVEDALVILAFEMS